MADNYTYDFQRLQQDAIRRAREMQARAQAGAPLPNSNPPRPQASPPAFSAPAAPVSAPPRSSVPEPSAGQRHEHEPSFGPLSPVKDIFDSLMSDSERTLILVLILLLSEEKADMGLIFALMYLVI